MPDCEQTSGLLLNEQTLKYGLMIASLTEMPSLFSLADYGCT